MEKRTPFQNVVDVEPIEFGSQTGQIDKVAERVNAGPLPNALRPDHYVACQLLCAADVGREWLTPSAVHKPRYRTNRLPHREHVVPDILQPLPIPGADRFDDTIDTPRLVLLNERQPLLQLVETGILRRARLTGRQGRRQREREQ